MAAIQTIESPESISFMPMETVETNEQGVERVETKQLALVDGNIVTRKSGKPVYFLSTKTATTKVILRVKQGRFVVGAKLLTKTGNLSKAGKAILSDSGMRLATKGEVKVAQAAKAERAAERKATRDAAAAPAAAPESESIIAALRAQLAALVAAQSGETEAPETETPEVGEEDDSDLDCI
jgi:hypothetical protein